MSRLREVGSEDYTPPQAAEPAQPNVSLQLLLLALKALSQRFVIAIAAIRGLILAGSVFWLSMTIMGEPSASKLTGLGIYSAFCLTLEFMVARRK